MKRLSFLMMPFIVVQVVYWFLAISRGETEQIIRTSGLVLLSVGIHLFYWKYKAYAWIEILLQTISLGWLFGSYYNFYETISWYDEVVHGLAPGVWCLVALLYGKKWLRFEMPLWFYCLSIMAISMILWVLWEGYEYYIGYSIFHSFPMTLGDTISDLLLDLGGSSAFALGYYLRNRGS